MMKKPTNLKKVSPWQVCLQEGQPLHCEMERLQGAYMRTTHQHSHVDKKRIHR